MHTPSAGAVARVPCSLLACLLGDNSKRASEALAELRPRLRCRARRLAPYLRDDLLDDVIQELWCILIQRGGLSALKPGVEEEAFITMTLRNAIESVWAGHRPAGTRSRRQRRAPAEPAPDFDHVALLVAASTNGIDDESNVRIDVERIYAKMGVDARRALKLMLAEGKTATEAASEVGLTRQTLARRLQPLRLAA